MIYTITYVQCIDNLYVRKCLDFTELLHETLNDRPLFCSS